MKYFSSLILSLSVLTFSSALHAETKPHTDPDPKMEAFIKASTPGTEHQLLKQYVGKWNHTMSWWMSPDAKPEISQGTSEIKSILGGRFIEQNVSGTSMGQPYEGMGITGYDNVNKHFSTMWIDNMSTGTMSGKATLDKGKNALVDKGEFSCPLDPSGTKSYRSVWSLPKGDSFTYEMYGAGEDGKEFRMMEIVYKKG